MNVTRTQLYMAVWTALFVLTGLEVGAASMGLGRAVLISALVGMSAVKAACVALFYMHLYWEKAWLGVLAVSPFVITATFAVVLMLENGPR